MPHTLALSAATRRWLHASAALSGGVALLHLAIIFAGPAGYAYFGAQPLADLEAAGSARPDLITAALVLFFATWSYYGWAAAGTVAWRPPLLTAGFWTIGAIYTLRGTGVVPEFLGLVYGVGNVPVRFVVFSAASLAIGLCHLRGAFLRRRELRARSGSGSPR